LKKAITLLTVLIFAFQALPGSICPDFTFADITGKKYTLSTLVNSGKYVALDFVTEG
jgi:hypothetical protein